jgi:hypothetical protein
VGNSDDDGDEVSRPWKKNDHVWFPHDDREGTQERVIAPKSLRENFQPPYLSYLRHESFEPTFSCFFRTTEFEFLANEALTNTLCHYRYELIAPDMDMLTQYSVTERCRALSSPNRKMTKELLVSEMPRVHFPDRRTQCS